MNRREYLVGVTSATGLLAGCNELPELSATGEDDDDDDDKTATPEPAQVQIVREYYRALDEGDISTANELIHPESPVGEISPDRADQYRDELSLAVESASLNEVDGDRATVDVTVVLEQTTDSQTERRTLAVELRETGDGWRLYDSGQREETTPTEMTPDDVSEVTRRIQVVSAVGRNIENETVRTVQFVVQKAPGTGDIDLSQLLVEWIDSSGVYTLTHGERPDENTFTVNAIRDDNDSLSGNTPVIDDSSDRALIWIGLPTFRESGLEAGAAASVQLMTESGTTAERNLQVPDSLSGVEAVQL